MHFHIRSNRYCSCIFDFCQDFKPRRSVPLYSLQEQTQLASCKCEAQQCEEMLHYPNSRIEKPKETSCDHCTGAIKLVAESFPWTKESKFVYSKDNHTSILGVREVAKSQGASAESIPAPTLEGRIYASI